MLTIINNALNIMPPILLASLGGLFTSIAGTLNIALEGYILISAFTVALVYTITGNLFLSIITSVFVTILISFLQSVVNIKLKTNPFISALGVNMFCSGMAAVVSQKLFNHKGVIYLNITPLKIIGLSFKEKIPVLGELLFGYNIFVYMSFILCFLCFLIIYHTSFGLRLRSVGFDEEASLASSININKYKIISFMISGFFSSLAGIYLFLTVGSYVPNISAGYGWIALVLIYIGLKKPSIILMSSFIFSLSEVISNYAQGAFNVASDFILAIPFAVSLIFMILYSVFIGFRKKIV